MLHFRNLGDPNVAATPKVVADAVGAAAAAAEAVANAAAAVVMQPMGDLKLPAVVVVAAAANQRCNRQTSRAMPLVASKSTVAGGCNCCCSHCCCRCGCC